MPFWNNYLHRMIDIVSLDSELWCEQWTNPITYDLGNFWSDIGWWAEWIILPISSIDDRIEVAESDRFTMRCEIFSANLSVCIEIGEDALDSYRLIIHEKSTRNIINVCFRLFLERGTTESGYLIGVFVHGVLQLRTGLVCLSGISSVSLRVIAALALLRYASSIQKPWENQDYYCCSVITS